MLQSVAWKRCHKGNSSRHRADNMQFTVLVKIVDRINVGQVFANAVKRILSLPIRLKPCYGSTFLTAKVFYALPLVRTGLRSLCADWELSLLSRFRRDHSAIMPLVQLVYQVVKGSAQVIISISE